MLVDGRGEISLKDLGGIPVIWQDGVGVRQDPSYGANVYAPSAVFQDDGGQLYQLGSDFHIRTFGAAPLGGSTVNPSTQPQVIVVQTPSGGTQVAPANTTRSAGGGSSTRPGSQTSQQPPLQVTGNLGQWLDQDHAVFGIPVRGSLIALGGAASVMLLARRRRR